MLVLGIETATPICAVALWSDGHLLAENRCRAKSRHGEIIAGMIEYVFELLQLDTGDLNGVAVSKGPGSFTGLRIGMSMAKALAYSHKIPIVGVSTPDAIASGIAPVADRLAVVLPSRKGEVYAAPYRYLDGFYHREGGIEALPIEEFESWAEKIRYVAGPGIPALIEAGINRKTFLPDIFWEVGAAPVARMGARKLLAGEQDDLSSLEPDYVKPFFTTAKPKKWAEPV